MYLCQLSRYWAKLIPSRGVWPILEGSALKGYLAQVSACLWKGWGFSLSVRYRKIPKISPGAYFFSKALFEGLIFGAAYIRRGLYSEKLIYGGKFVFQNRLG